MHSSGEMNCIIRELEGDLDRSQAEVVAFKENDPTLPHIYPVCLKKKKSLKSGSLYHMSNLDLCFITSPAAEFNNNEQFS